MTLLHSKYVMFRLKIILSGNLGDNINLNGGKHEKEQTIIHKR